MHLYFHDAAQVSPDYVPPAVVSDLSLETTYRDVLVRWTAPGDDGTTGQATAYDLRYSTSPITLANFASATPISTGAPDPAGTPQCADLITATCPTYWFAIRTRDECDNWSGLGNVVSGTPNCASHFMSLGCDNGSRISEPIADEADAPRVVEFSLAGSNPVVGPSAVAFGIPASKAGQRLEIAIFDLAGRRVRTLQVGAAHAGRFRVQWNERAAVASGAYFLTMRLGEEARVKKFVLVR